MIGKEEKRHHHLPSQILPFRKRTMETPNQSISALPQTQQQQQESGGNGQHTTIELVDLEQLSLPKEETGLLDPTVYFYRNFWCPSEPLRYFISSEISNRPFEAHNTDIIIVDRPKSGTTWLKALLFCVVNRRKYPVVSEHSSRSQYSHPLLTANPHSLVLPFQHVILNPRTSWFYDFPKSPPPRLYSTHMPYHALPESIKTSGCKIIYLYRNPLDNLVSKWHFARREGESEEESSRKLEKFVDMFCKGTDTFGPFWDHVLGAWKESQERPQNFFFIRYEDLKEDPISQVKMFSEFIGYKFTPQEEEEGVIQGIVKLCSLESLKNMEVNKSGRNNFVTNDKYFRKGVVGDWVNYLTPSMVDRVSKVVKEKFQGTGFVP